MNWKLIINLSVFGFAMGIGTVFWIPMSLEPYCWLVIFIICALQIANRVTGKFFLHGFLLSLVNSVWVTSFHLVFHDDYYAFHPDMQVMYDMLDYPRLATLITGPIIGAVSGIVQGLFAFIAAKIIR